jgi:predicted SAM-dependent methyltransferase
MRFDVLRLRARTRQGKRGTVTAPHASLHLGCGKRHVPGWLNVDVAGSEHDVDLACGSLPWRDASFDRIVSQQVIEHLDLAGELVPLFRELRRVCKPGAEFWMACPDLATTCRAYDQDRAAALLSDRDARCIADSGIGDIPTQHFINMQFQQFGEHKNLLDLELIEWLCRKTGFGRVTKVDEADMMAKFPEFPFRNDNMCSIYVRAIAV